jgi:hypothetical protein
VAGLGIRIYTDEQVFRGLARALRNHGYDAESRQEAGRANRGISDDEQLAYAARTGRAILTENVTDFIVLDAEWKRVGRAHAGIIVVSELGEFGELLRRVERHLNVYLPEVQRDTLVWLDPGPTR